MKRLNVPPKPCVSAGCHNFAYKGPRCSWCEKAFQAKRNRQPERALYRDPAYKAAVSYGICWLCGEPGADTRDHVRPISKGGTNAPENLRPAHRACNSSKGSK